MKQAIKETLLKIGKAMAAGLVIGIAGTMYLSVQGNAVAAALIFSIGLISVIMYKLNLYTGKIGYIQCSKEIPNLILMLAYNIIGAMICALCVFPMVGLQATIIIGTKLSLNWYITFIKAILCGVCIYLSVDLYKTTNNIFMIIFPVFIFVLCGFDHCIANAFYWYASSFYSPAPFSWRPIIYETIVIIGNSIGSLLIALIKKLQYNNNEDKK